MSPFANHPDELISASVSGDLTDVERRQLEAHLAGCERCRATLAAFSAQRQLLAGMEQPPVPRDLGVRVNAGIESGRFAAPWWRRPGAVLAGAASLATVAAAALLVLFVVNQTNGPNIGHQSPTASPTPAATSEPTAPASASPAPSATPAAAPLGMQAGDLVYLQVTGPFDGLKLTVIDAQSGEKRSISNPGGSTYGRIERAALSPDGRLLAFADTGLKGSWRIFVANLADGSVQRLAETWPLQLGKRLAWSPDGRYLAFTVSPADGDGSSSDVWLYDRDAGAASQLTRAGNAYFASWAPVGPGDNEQLWVSLGEANPVSELAQFPVGEGIPGSDPLAGEATTVAGFAPLVSPDGQRVLFWTGTMMHDGNSGWVFSKGGMPQLGAYVPAPGSGTWQSQALFSDLAIQPGGAAFSYGELAWAADSDAYAFWDGIWTGTPEGDNYPDGNAVYVGRVSDGQLSSASAVSLGDLASPQGDMTVNDVSLAPDGGTAVVTLAVPLPGDLVAPRSYLRIVPVTGGSPTDVGSGGADPPPWSGPGIVVPAGVGS
jgi:anti-sigma factor RsiW